MERIGRLYTDKKWNADQSRNCNIVPPSNYSNENSSSDTKNSDLL